MLEFNNLTEGISYDGNTFDVSFFHKDDSDIIDVCVPFINQTKFDNLTYFFGYQFKPDVSSNVRTKFLHWIKGLDKSNMPSEFTVENLVEPPIAELNKIVNLSTFLCTLYPRSNRSDLTRIIQRGVVHLIPRMNIESFELVKSTPKNIGFDWKQFNLDYQGTIGDHQYQQIKQHIEETLLPKIHNLDYFSIAQNVKYKYREYITNYLQFETTEQEELFRSLNGGNILVLDDINTSGATLTEILKIVRSLAPESKIFIFTLIGNDRSNI